MTKEPRIVLIENIDIVRDDYGQGAYLLVRTNLEKDEMAECNRKFHEEFGKFLWYDPEDKDADRDDVLFYNHCDSYISNDLVVALRENGIDLCKNVFIKFDIDTLNREGKVSICNTNGYSYILINGVSLMAKKFISPDAVFCEDKSLPVIGIYGGYGLSSNER